MTWIRAAVVSAALALSAAPAMAQELTRLVCHGTEPFWSVTVEPRAMWYSDPDTKRLELVPVSPMRASHREPDFIRVYRTKRTDGRGGDVILVVTRNRQSCSDGMTDTRYAYSAVYITEGVLEGCCNWRR